MQFIGSTDPSVIYLKEGLSPRNKLRSTAVEVAKAPAPLTLLNSSHDSNSYNYQPNMRKSISFYCLLGVWTFLFSKIFIYHSYIYSIYIMF